MKAALRPSFVPQMVSHDSFHTRMYDIHMYPNLNKKKVGDIEGSGEDWVPQCNYIRWAISFFDGSRKHKFKCPYPDFSSLSSLTYFPEWSQLSSLRGAFCQVHLF